MRPMLSVIITCYNQEKFIAQSIDSVLSQTRIDLIKEIIVVDDGSTDNSKEIIYKKTKESGLIKYIYQQNKGAASARNNGINASEGDFVAFLDGDDIWLPSKIENQLDCFKKDSNIGLVYSNFYEVDSVDISKRKKIKARKYSPADKNTLSTFFVKDGPIITSTVIIKKIVFKETGIFDPSFQMGEDPDLWLRIAAKYSFCQLSEPLLLKRVVSNSLGSDKELNTYYYTITTKKIVEQYPHLHVLVNKRHARRKTKLAIYYEKIGKKVQSRKTYMKAIRLDIFFWKPYFYLLVSFFPDKFKSNILKSLKSLRHGI
jgi:glycosyltransferase involved in cell wall biosynthesis